MPDFGVLRETLSRFTDFVLTTHVNPDADALGSEMALYHYLVQHGKHVRIINYSETPYYLHFLDTQSIAEKYNSKIHDDFIASSECLIFLDLNIPNRTVKMETALMRSPAFKVCIDHHTNPSDSFNLIITDTCYSSTGELLYDFLFEECSEPITLQYANPLYAAIMTDTGSFRFDRTTPRVHRIAAMLLEAGVQPNIVYDHIYDQSKLSKIHLLAEALQSIQLYSEGSVAVITIPYDKLLHTQALETDTDGFVNYCMSVEGVKIGMLFLELLEGFKVSFRSKGLIPVNQLAAEFGGGGHRNASGLRIRDAKMQEYYDEIINRAEAYLNREEMV